MFDRSSIFSTLIVHSKRFTKINSTKDNFMRYIYAKLLYKMFYFYISDQLFKQCMEGSVTMPSSFGLPFLKCTSSNIILLLFQSYDSVAMSPLAQEPKQTDSTSTHSSTAPEQSTVGMGESTMTLFQDVVTATASTPTLETYT
jgi:hypothetical protein